MAHSLTLGAAIPVHAIQGLPSTTAAVSFSLHGTDPERIVLSSALHVDVLRALLDAATAANSPWAQLYQEVSLRDFLGGAGLVAVATKNEPKPPAE